MYNHAPEDYDCPLCHIARGEPTAKGSAEENVLHRDEHVTVFIAGRWLRSNPGHLLVIPNKHYENIYDLSDKVGHKIADWTKKCALFLKQAYNCDGTSTRQHNEPAGSQDAFHYHMHVFPRYKDDGYYDSHDTYWPEQEEFTLYLEKLKPYFNF